MNLRYIIPLIAVIVLFLIAYLGAQVSGLQYVFGVVIPYLALITFVAGFAYRVIDWSRSAVPFKIPTIVLQLPPVKVFGPEKQEKMLIRQ